jgi:uracil-DNA glycosylase family 4
VDFEEFRKELLDCRYCATLGIDPNPIVWGESSAKVVQISQAPSQSASESGRPFSKSLYESDASGKKLIEWYAIPRETFYNPEIFYITGMGHCYPGKDQGGDARPPLVCADRWLKKELSYLNPNLYIIVGRHAASYLYSEKNFTELVFQSLELNHKPTFVLPHPSPANKKWFKDNPDFETKRMHDIRKTLHEALQ